MFKTLFTQCIWYCKINNYTYIKHFAMFMNWNCNSYVVSVTKGSGKNIICTIVFFNKLLNLLWILYLPASAHFLLWAICTLATCKTNLGVLPWHLGTYSFAYYNFGINCLTKYAFTALYEEVNWYKSMLMLIRSVTDKSPLWHLCMHTEKRRSLWELTVATVWSNVA